MGHHSDREKFTALLDEHGAPLVAMLRRLCGNPHDADDVFQETAIRVWRSFSSRPWLRNPKSWLMTISQMANAMGISDGTAKSRLNAALTKLRKALE